MGYIKNNLRQGESLLYTAKIHNFIFVFPVFLTLMGLIFLSPYLTGVISEMTVINYIGLVLLTWGGLSLICRFFAKSGADYGITDQRIIFKSGIIKRDVVELQKNKYEGLVMKQPILGRIFNYATFIVTTGGVTKKINFVANAKEFKSRIN